MTGKLYDSFVCLLTGKQVCLFVLQNDKIRLQVLHISEGDVQLYSTKGGLLPTVQFIVSLQVVCLQRSLLFMYF